MEKSQRSIPRHKFDANHDSEIWIPPPGSFVVHFADPLTSLVFVCFILISENLQKFVGWNEVELGISSRQLQ